MLAAGGGSIPGGILLAADLSASGDFVAVARMDAPSPALLAAVHDLLHAAAGPGLREVLIYSLASNIRGTVFLESANSEGALQAFSAASLLVSWRISISGLGTLQALFLIARFSASETTERAFELELKLAGKPELLEHEAKLAVV